MTARPRLHDLQSRASAAGAARGARHPADSPGFLLWRLTLRWQRAISGALRPLDLSHVQFVLLACLWWLTEAAGDERPSQRQLAEFAAADPMMTSQVLRALEARGLVSRTADPHDSRARRLGVTPAGAALARRAIEVVEATDADFFRAVGDQDDLLDLLRRVA